jgi:predicted nucleic acid-binding protein
MVKRSSPVTRRSSAEGYDPNDDHVIATALAVKAEAIVTGDKDLLALGEYQAVRIITARAFLTELVPDA